MIEIRYLQAESGANKFGTCNCCGKSSGEDPLMISIKFSYYGHGTLICLCDDCRKKLIEVLNGEQLPPAQPAPSQVAKDIARIVENEQDMRVIAQGRIRGHWIPVGGALYQCDQCGVVSLKRKFCSECGADMREETE